MDHPNNLPAMTRQARPQAIANLPAGATGLRLIRVHTGRGKVGVHLLPNR